MRSCYRVALLAIVLSQTVALLAASDQEDRLQASKEVLQQILDTPDNSIPTTLLDRSACIGIIPSVKKLAFVFGGRYGAGYVLCRTNYGKGPWGAPSAFMIGGGSFGFQIGVSATDYVLLFMNQGAIDKLLQDKFTLGADMSVAAGPVGRSAEAATDAQMTAQILSYSRSKGLFAGVALNGAVLRADNDDNRALYGKEVSAKDILITGSVPPPPSAQPLIQLLTNYNSAAASPAGSAASSGYSQTSPPAKTGPGSFSGLVRDTKGAVVPGAAITVTNSQTGESRWATSGPDGHYTVAGLDPGSYTLNAKSAGLTPVTTPPITLQAGGDQIIDFKLESSPQSQ